MKAFLQERSRSVNAAAGIVSGLTATGLMTVAMIAGHRRLPADEQDPLPPRATVEKLAARLRLERTVAEREKSAATLLAHFGYGGAMGFLYSLLFGNERTWPVLKGLSFGLIVWAGSYLGLLPSLGILRSATRMPARRNLLMIAVHCIWGGALGFLVKLYAEESQPSLARRTFTSRTAPLSDLQRRSSSFRRR